MAWLRIGDTAHGDPRRLALNDPRNDLIGKAAWGFFIDVADMCAEHFTDYVAPRGFIDRAGAGPGDVLLKRCVQAGLMFPAGGKGPARQWRIIDDAPELIHMRSRGEVTWERDQKADTGNLRYRTVAMLRDGDACRYCGVVCQPNDHKAGRGRTLDHLQPGRKALSPDDLVTCCVSCNSARNRDWQDEANRAGYAARWPLRSVPDQRIYRESTRDWLASKGHELPPGSRVVPSGVPINHWTEAATAPAQPTQTSRNPAGGHQTHPGTPGVANGASTTPSHDQHPGTRPGVAASDDDGTTHPTSVGVAVPSTPGPPHTAPAAVAQPGPAGPPHPGPRPGVAQPDPAGTRGSRGDGPGRAGPGRVSGPAPPPTAATPGTAMPRPGTRRGRRRTGSPTTQQPHHTQED